MLQNYNKAIYYYNKAVREEPELPGVYQNLGIAYFKIGDNKSALENLHKETVRNRKAIEEYSGKMFFTTERLERVFGTNQKILKTARIAENIDKYIAELERSANNKQVHNGSGLSFSAMKDSGRAINEYRAALKIDPNYIEARGNLGIEYMNVGRYKEAEAELKKVAEADPYSETAHYQLRKLYEIMKKNAEFNKENEILKAIRMKSVQGINKR